MNTCRVCGDPNAKVRPRSKLTLCDACHADTPQKVTRGQFDNAYWGEHLSEVPDSTKREFFDDYRTSTHTLPEYIRATTQAV